MNRSTQLLVVAPLLALATVAALTARAQEPAPATPAPPAAAPAPGSVSEAASRLSQLWWMAGTWEGDLFNATFEEHWMRPRAGIMLGSGRLMREGKTVFIEFLRIEATDDGRVLYTVWPGAKTPTTYELTTLKYDAEKQLGHAIFTNPKHEGQHTIEYLWNGEGIAGRIAGVRDGKDWEKRFKFHASADGRKAPDSMKKE